ncbi:hypothetical protein ZIOFF_046863 [Zingiber officinale]|uniref:Leucine-rich repeat-containing N-terminal plant-type domain-containing protein n=1 Tax=Zingiber officinale TaxID=94328 RepID=A0A8J5FWT1_ZINOF|nr:hypothetical protein ZIOFF_046863 [Zingiber officinale]
MYELTQSLYEVPSNWTPQLDPCTWDGVICSRGRVIAINLAQRDIFESLSPALGNITSLTSLQREFNNICSPLPRLRKLSSLQKIYLQANAFDSIPRLIPDFLGSLLNLDILHLSYNQLTGPLQRSFAGSILTKLFLDHQQSGDKISDRIDVIGAMPQLTMTWL